MRRLAIVLLISVVMVIVRQQGPIYAASIADILIQDMSQPSEGTPHGVAGYSWEKGPTGGDFATFPSGFGAIQGWGDLYEDIGGNPATNSRVQLRNFQTWWLSKNTNQWIQAQYENNFGGAAFTEDYNSSKDGNIVMIDGLPTITAGGGYNFHFWHTQDGWNIPSAGDYKAIVTAYEVRLVLGNPSGPDDRAQAKYVIKSANDTYVAQNNHGSDGKLPGMGTGRAKYVTSNWRLVTHNTVTNYDASIIRNNPPPLVIGADNVDVNGGTTSCPKKTQGDADCDGSIKLADYEKWRQEYTGVLTTKTADFNASGTVTLADYEVWRRSYLSGA